MSELTLDQLVKIIVGLVVVALVVVGVYFLFKEQFLGFFKGLSVDNSIKIFLGSLK